MAKDETLSQQTRSPVDALLVAARAFVGVVARSLAEADADLTPPQLRALMIVATRGAMNLSGLSAVMGVHPSNATRVADVLVRRGFIHRTEAVGDRRRTDLSLTTAGRSLIDAIIEHRKSAFQEILDHLDEREQRALTKALTAFATAAGEPDEPWQPGWEWPS